MRDGNLVDTYHVWKGWIPKNFGRPSVHECAYFSREIAGLRLRTGSRVLEIGFGNGNFLGFARARGYEIEGAELDSKLVKIAADQGYTVYFIEEVFKNQFSGSYDLVVAFDVLEHIEKASLATFISHIRSLLVPGGCFLARFPNGQSPFGLHPQHGDLTHQTVLSGEILRQLAVVANFEVLSIRNPRIRLHTNPFLALGRLLQFSIRRAIELTISAAYHSNVVPMDPNLVVVLRRPSEAPPKTRARHEKPQSQTAEPDGYR